MSNFPNSVSLAVSAAVKADANRLAVAMGWDTAPGATFSVPLSAAGSLPATHWACHTWAGDEFVSTLTAAAGGALPAIPWADFGLTEGKVTDVLAALLSRVQTGAVGFEAFLTANGLQRASTGP